MVNKRIFDEKNNSFQEHAASVSHFPNAHLDFLLVLTNFSAIHGMFYNF